MTVFFVGGVNRSGTTLLQSILCSDTTTNPLIHEASYLRNIVEAYVFGLAKFEEHGKYYFSSTQDLKQFTADWAKSFLDKTRLRYPESTHLVLKHPPLTPRFPDLCELLSCIDEDPKFLILVRDPRDVVASLVRVGEKLREKGESEGNTIPRDMAVLGNYYLQCYMPALSVQKSEYKSRTLLIKYEDLIKSTESVLNRIREWSGLKLDIYDANSNWNSDEINYENLKQDKNAWLSDLWGKKMSSARIGNYKTILKPEEIKILEKVCAGPISTFGYQDN